MGLLGFDILSTDSEKTYELCLEAVRKDGYTLLYVPEHQ